MWLVGVNIIIYTVIIVNLNETSYGTLKHECFENKL